MAKIECEDFISIRVDLEYHTHNGKLCEITHMRQSNNEVTYSL